MSPPFQHPRLALRQVQPRRADCGPRHCGPPVAVGWSLLMLGESVHHLASLRQDHRHYIETDISHIPLTLLGVRYSRFYATARLVLLSAFCQREKASTSRSQYIHHRPKADESRGGKSLSLHLSLAVCFLFQSCRARHPCCSCCGYRRLRCPCGLHTELTTSQRYACCYYIHQSLTRASPAPLSRLLRTRCRSSTGIRQK